MKGQILICTAIMLNDHSNPYIESTTVLSDNNFLILLSIYVHIHVHVYVQHICAVTASNCMSINWKLMAEQ